MIDGYPVGFELVIGRAEDDPPAALYRATDVVEFVKADSHIGVMVVSHRLWPIGTRSAAVACIVRSALARHWS